MTDASYMAVRLQQPSVTMAKYTCASRSSCHASFGIVQVIADPAMHSMPAAAKHPSGKWLCYQSLDSQIVTYGCSGKFRQNKKKVFKGHLVGGNACQVRSMLPVCLLFSWLLPGRVLGVSMKMFYRGVSLLPGGKFFISSDSVSRLLLSATTCA